MVEQVPNAKDGLTIAWFEVGFVWFFALDICILFWIDWIIYVPMRLIMSTQAEKSDKYLMIHRS